MTKKRRLPHTLYLAPCILLFLLLAPQLALSQTLEEEEEPFEPTSEPTSGPAGEPASAPVSEPPLLPEEPSPEEPPSEEPALSEAARPLSFLLEQPKDALFSIARDPVQLNLFVQLQTQIAIFVGNEAFLEEDSPAIEKGYRVKRARTGLWGGFLDEFGYVVTLDLRDEVLPEGAGLEARPVGARLLDAAISWKRYPFAIITVGANKIPFSRGAMASSFTTTFQESPFTISRLAPQRRAGISLSGSFERFSYVIGQYNTSESLTFGSLGGGLLSMGRVELTPLGPVDPNQSGTRDFEGTRFALGGGGYIALSGTQRTLSATADLLLQAGAFTALAETIFSQVEPRAAPELPGGPADTINRFGAYGQLGWMILPDRLEVAARTEIFDDNVAVRDEGDILAFTGGASLISYGYRVRTTLNFTKRLELAGNELSNDLLLLEVGARF